MHYEGRRRASAAAGRAADLTSPYRKAGGGRAVTTKRPDLPTSTEGGHSTNGHQSAERQ